MTIEAIAGLGASAPVLVAPMAGGPTTAALVVGAGRAGSLGFLAGGYQEPAALAAQIAEVRAAGVAFGVNLFAPSPDPVDRDAFRRYAAALRAEADRSGLRLADEPLEDDDRWGEKLALLLAEPVPVASFTFGIPDASDVAALRAAGTFVVQTVTSAAEARAAEEAGVDALALQAPSAGGHFGTLTPRAPSAPAPLTELVVAVGSSTRLPVIAAGGLGGADDVLQVLRAGGAAAMLGSAFLLADEAGTTAVHRAALTEPVARETVVTRAFTGRPARGLRNGFIDRHEADAPPGYPAVHHLTSPLRKAAAAAGDPECVHLWAGTAYRQARTGPIADLLSAIVERL